jgi:hypothetical protein
MVDAKTNRGKEYFHQLLWSIFWAMNPKTRAKEPGASGTPDLIAPFR